MMRSKEISWTLQSFSCTLFSVVSGSRKTCGRAFLDNPKPELSEVLIFHFSYSRVRVFNVYWDPQYRQCVAILPVATHISTSACAKSVKDQRWTLCCLNEIWLTPRYSREKHCTRYIVPSPETHLFLFRNLQNSIHANGQTTSIKVVDQAGP